MDEFAQMAAREREATRIARGEFVASSVTVVTIAGDRFVALDRFDAGVFRHFSLPAVLRD